MNALQQIVFTSGQRVHEELYGAVLTIYGEPIPATSSKPMDNWVFLASGLSPSLFIKTLRFRRDKIDPSRISTTRKGLQCALQLNDQTDPIKIQLWEGGLEPSGLVFEFQAVDASFMA